MLLSILNSKKQKYEIFIYTAIFMSLCIAELYGVETRRLKEQVNRNIERFPERYMFELTKEEYNSIRSQNATLKHGAHSKYLPYMLLQNMG